MKKSTAVTLEIPVAGLEIARRPSLIADLAPTVATAGRIALGVVLAIPVHLTASHLGTAGGLRLLGALSVASAWLYVFLGIQSGRRGAAVQGVAVAVAVAVAAIWIQDRTPAMMALVFGAQAAWSLRLLIDRDESEAGPVVAWLGFNLALAVLTGIAAIGM